MSRSSSSGRIPHIQFHNFRRQQWRPHRRLSCSSDQLYHLLSIPSNATQIEVDQAYRKILRRFKNPKAKAKPSRSVWEASLLAYEVLSSQPLRSLYDLEGLDALSGRHAALKDLLGIPKGNLKTLVYIDLEEAAHGVQKSVTVDAALECHACSGQGNRDGSTTSCAKCGGEGVVVVSYNNLADTRIPQRRLRKGICPSCGGTGEQSRQLCITCRGSGVRKVQRSVKVRIPAGIESGAMLIAKGYGNLTALGSTKGDLFIGVLIRSHTLYDREGPDVHSVVDVPLLVAMLGGVVQASTVWGIESLSIPPGTQHEDKLPLPRAGLPYQGSSSRGTHICTIKIIIPHYNSFENPDLLLQLKQLL